MSDKVDRSLQHKCRNSVRIRAPAPSSLLVCVSGELGTTEPTGDMTKDTLKEAGAEAKGSIKENLSIF